MNVTRLEDREVPWILIRKNIRNLYARLKPEGYVQITGPRGTTPAAAEAFLLRLAPRLLSHLRMLEPTPLGANDSVLVWGTRIPCLPDPGLRRPAFSEGILRLPVDAAGNPNGPALERFYGEMIQKEIPRILEARNLDGTDGWDLGGLVFKTQRMTSRLGSCQTVRRIIKLNTVLGRFNRKYLEAVLLHELCHLRVSNHGPEFYRLLSSLVPDYRKLRNETNKLVKTIGR